MSLAGGIDVTKDGSSRANLYITYPHSAVHRDIIARATRIYPAADNTTNIIFKAPGPLQPHLEWTVTGGNDLEVRLYKGPTIADEGTDMTKARLFLPSAKTTQMVTKTGATISENGTLIDEAYNGGGGTGAGIRGGAAVHDDAEWVIEVDVWYLLQIIRGQSAKMSVALEWYEVPEIKT